MKQLLPLLLNLAFLNSFSQAAIKNMQLVNSDTNLLYVGVENILKVTGVNNALVTMTAANCEIKRINNCEFNLKSKIIGSDTINIYKDGKLLLKKRYELKAITNPFIQVSTFASHEGSTREILLNPNLTVIRPYILLAYDLSVIRFSGYFLRQNGDVINAFSNESNHFSIQQLSTIANLKAGDKILFEKIIIKVNGDSTKHLQQFTFTIK